MEEERLVLLKEHKESQEQFESACQKRDELVEQNDTLRGQLTVFERELLSLKDEVSSAQKQQKENNNAANAPPKKQPVTFSGLKKNTSTASLNKPSLKTRVSSTLKFTSPSEKTAAQQICAQCKGKSKPLEDPVQKSLS